MTAPAHVHPDPQLTDLVLGTIANRPPWLGVCRWCLVVIYQPHGQWQHVHHGIIMCAHPLPGAPPYAMAHPLAEKDLTGHLRRLLRPPPRAPSPGDRPMVGGAARDRSPAPATGVLVDQTHDQVTGAPPR